MEKENLLNYLKAFDAEIFELLQEELRRQRYTLSLVPTVNAMSPLSAYLEGSLLTNSSPEGHAAGKNAVEDLVRTRVQQLFSADHAIVRLGNIAAASRVVFHALLQAGDRVLSFNLRKQEHCAGLNYTFENFGISPDTQTVDWDAVMTRAKSIRPRLLIFSPVSYPRIPDYAKLAEIAHAVGASLWVDIGQSVGLVAAGLLPSPVSAADIVTFPTNASLHGPNGAIILCKKALAQRLDDAVVNTGHTALHINHLAALTIALREAGTETFRRYGKQVLINSKELEHTFEKEGIPLLCGGTETHLVLPALSPKMQEIDITAYMAQAGFQVKSDNIPTMQAEHFFPALRLSSLNPTTRSLKRKDMAHIGKLLAKPLKDKLPDSELESIRNQVATLVMNQPIFSEEWLTTGSTGLRTFYNNADSSAAHEFASNEKRNIIKSFFHISD